MAKLDFTTTAKDFIKKLKNQYKDFIIYISGGCCEGSAALVYERSDFKIGTNDVKLGEFDGIEVYVHTMHYSYLKENELSINAIKGNASEFSLDYGLGEHFVLESKCCKI